MYRLLSRGVVARRIVLISAALPAIGLASNVRIVSYNTQDDVNPPTPAGALPYLETTIEGVGQQQYVGDGILKLPDIIPLQETTSNSATVAPIVSALNTYYNHPNLYASSSYQATTSDGTTDGGGPNALIYNQTTMNLIASVGVGTPASASNGEYRQVVRYEFQPLVDAGTSTGIFYIYDQHAKSGSAGTVSGASGSPTDGTLRNEEAVIVRADETSLPANSAVIYIGDFNVDGSTDASFQTYTAAGQGQGIDPLDPTDDYTQDWGTAAYKAIMTESDTDLRYRDDLQLMTNNIYNGSANTLTYVTGSLHAFGNSGNTSTGASINKSTNPALNDINTVTRSNVLPAGSLTSTQVFAAMNGSIGSDHLPVVADYTIAGFNNGIWTGGTGNWSNFTYWTNEATPNTSSGSLEVKIDNGNSAISVVTMDVSATIADLTLDANNTLNINSGETLALVGPVTSFFKGTFTNAGTLTAGAIANTGNFNTSGSFAGSGIFNNSGTVFIGGTQNWSAGTVFTNTAGTAVFATDAGTASKLNLNINVSGGSVTFATTEHLAGLNISSGAKATVARNSSGGRSVLIASNPTLAGTLDLGSNDLDAAGSSLVAITNLVRHGYSSGSTGLWTGTGITSSAAATNTAHLTALGVIQNNQSGSALFTASHPLDGVTPGISDILVRYTYVGDANLDGKVDGSDYSLIDSGFLTHATTWFGGDFNYDGVVNGSDYTLIDNAFNTQGAVLTASLANPTAIISADSTSTSSVPEPAVGMGMCVACLALSRRRNRRDAIVVY